MSEVADINFEKLPKEWEIGLFSSDLKIQGRIGWKGYKTTDLVNEGPLVIGGTEIKSSIRLSLDNVKHLSREKYEESPEIMLKEGDVLLVTRGNLGEVGYYQADYGEGTINPSVIILKEFKGYSKFLFYYLISSIGRKYVLSLTSGSSIPAIYQSEVYKLNYPKPPLDEQKAIANILISFDDKIELLQAQNKTLEETAQTIFAEWFGKYSIDDELPEGYKFGELGDVAINHSKTFKFTNENVVFVNTGDVLDGQFLHSNEISPIGLPGQAKKVIELYDILYSEIRPKNKRFAFVDFDTSNYVVSTKFMIIRPKNDFSPFILYLILKNQDTIDEFNIVAESRSGTFPQITFDAVKSFPIVIPSKEKQNDFDNILLPIMEKKKLNHQQIQTLTKTRDELLPRLMSGEVRVNEFKV